MKFTLPPPAILVPNSDDDWSIITAAAKSSGPSSIVPDANKFTLVAVILTALAIPPIAYHSRKFLKDHSWAYRLVWVLAFAINYITVSIPGRIDGRVAGTDGKDTRNYPWKTLFEPAGWAFAIWGVIYITETILSGWVGAIGKPMEMFKKAAPFWAAGNLYQSLWCLVFRPEYEQFLWLPMLLLASASASMGLAHKQFTDSIDVVNGFWSNGVSRAAMLARFPLALHTGWLAAASLLNLNGWAAKTSGLGTQIAAAFSSSFLAAAVSSALAIASGDGFISATAAWALAALSYRTNIKAVDTRKNPKLNAVVSADVQEGLSIVEGILSKALQALSLVLAAKPLLKLFNQK